MDVNWIPNRGVGCSLNTFRIPPVNSAPGAGEGQKSLIPKTVQKIDIFCFFSNIFPCRSPCQTEKKHRTQLYKKGVTGFDESISGGGGVTQKSAWLLCTPYDAEFQKYEFVKKIDAAAGPWAWAQFWVWAWAWPWAWGEGRGAWARARRASARACVGKNI